MGQSARAARELGAAQGLLDAVDYVLEPIDRREIERAAALARSRLSASAFAANWAEGQRIAPEAAVAEALAHVAAAATAPATAPSPHPAGLTRREMEVVQLVAHGLTSAAVAERLSVSPRTVTTHLTAIYRKLGVTSRTEATRAALERGLA
jgi:non-specific serine/threonine protein kinase